MKKFTLVLLTSAAILSAAPALSQNSFTELGDLPGGSFTSDAYGISADGSVVIGRSLSASGLEAFRWTQGGGMVGLGDLAGGSFQSIANGVSADGSVVIGSSISADGVEAFRWTSGGGMVGLGDLAGGADSSVAYGVSADGSVVVGFGTNVLNQEAFRWTQGTGMVGLGTLGGSYSQARGVSADGSIVVGYSQNLGFLEEAFIWTSGGGMVGLGNLSGQGLDNSYANAVSADGNVIVGFAVDDFATIYEAFRWTQETGMQRVEDWLAAAGVSLAAGWTILSNATGVSADGGTVVGSGLSGNGTEAYIARVAAMGSGVIGIGELSTSISGAGTAAFNTQIGKNLMLNGAHHRPLILDQKVGGKNACAWATLDGALFTNEYDGYAMNQEAGLCHDAYDQRLRVGVGLGKNQVFQHTARGGEQDLDGTYGLIEVNYAPLAKPASAITGPVLGAIASYGVWDAQMQRGYLNGGTPDLSSGDTDVKAASLKLTGQWQEAAAFAVPLTRGKAQHVTLSPRASFAISRAEQDGYTETGGGFPARFDDHQETTREARLALETATRFNKDQTTLRLTLEGVHRFDDTAGGGSGEVIGLMDFALPEQNIKRNWMRVGLDADHTFANGVKLTGTSFIATPGQDPDISAALSLKVPF